MSCFRWLLSSLSWTRTVRRFLIDEARLLTLRANTPQKPFRRWLLPSNFHQGNHLFHHQLHALNSSYNKPRPIRPQGWNVFLCFNFIYLQWMVWCIFSSYIYKLGTLMGQHIGTPHKPIFKHIHTSLKFYSAYVYNYIKNLS